jgi:DEAD/DEAH box helicase domain-containing protein
VLYDTVPGGTGYLKQLMRTPAPLLDVLDVAREHLMNCSCTLEQDQDGCYSCLYAYRHSQDMKETSRSTAVTLLSDILSKRNELEKIKRLRDVAVNALLESELEARFIEALRQMKFGDAPVTLKNELVNGKPGYMLEIPDRTYYIEPQVHLGPADGVAVDSKVDFLFRLVRGKGSRKPIAVFTDGFLYHRERTGLDIAQRYAIQRSGRYLVWSITWKDVERRFSSIVDYFKSNSGCAPNERLFSHFCSQCNVDSMIFARTADSFSLFTDYLAHPDEEKWSRCAWVMGAIHLDIQTYTTREARELWHTTLCHFITPAMADQVGYPDESHLLGHFPSAVDHESSVMLFLKTTMDAVKTVDMKEMKVTCALLDFQDRRESTTFECSWIS